MDYLVHRSFLEPFLDLGSKRCHAICLSMPVGDLDSCETYLSRILVSDIVSSLLYHIRTHIISDSLTIGDKFIWSRCWPPHHAIVRYRFPLCICRLVSWHCLNILSFHFIFIWHARVYTRIYVEYIYSISSLLLNIYILQSFENTYSICVPKFYSLTVGPLFAQLECSLNNLICLWYNKSKYLTTYNKVSVLMFSLLFR